MSSFTLNFFSSFQVRIQNTKCLSFFFMHVYPDRHEKRNSVPNLRQSSRLLAAIVIPAIFINNRKVFSKIRWPSGIEDVIFVMKKKVPPREEWDKWPCKEGKENHSFVSTFIGEHSLWLISSLALSGSCTSCIADLVLPVDTSTSLSLSGS